MMREITIDQDKCVGTDICHICEAIEQGFPAYCSEYGRLIISPQSFSEHHKTITNFVARCPAQAILIKPINEE